MKRFMLTVCTLAFICAILVSCKKEEISPVVTEEEIVTDIKEEETKEEQDILEEEVKEVQISIEIREENRERKDENGILMLSITENYPVVTIQNNENASKKINEYFEAARETLRVMEDEYFTFALENYAATDEETREYWNGYGLGKTYEVARADEKVISIVESGYEYAGGAHPNSYKFTQNFNPETGEKLSLEDVSIEGDNDDQEDEDYDDAKDFIKDYLISYIEGSEYIDYVYPEFRDNIGDIIEDNTWYFSEDGIVIIANAYIIAPYAAGIMEFTIPYQDAVFLKDIYKM